MHGIIILYPWGQDHDPPPPPGLEVLIDNDGIILTDNDDVNLTDNT